MAKKKGKGKGNKKGKKVKKEGAETLHEVDKTFYELQIVDLNRKLARLKSYSTELEEKTENLQQQLNKTDSDRFDVINYLKRTLNEKSAEALELTERVTSLETSKESDEKEREDERKEFQVEFENMREQLTSEIKLITGKLNALEEFRMQRDELMTKFVLQEKQIDEQELRHKRNLYEVERKFILGKDAIKHEMEQQLFTLAKDFETANELRIAATTQRVIRENIVINNELNKLINASEYSQKENEALRARNKELTLFNELLETERNKAIKDFSIQKGVISQMVNEVTIQKNITASQECDIERGKKAENQLKLMKINEDILKDNVNLIEQKMHSIRCVEYLHKHDIKELTEHIRRLKGVIHEAMYVTQTVLSFGLDKQDEADSLLHNLNTTFRNILLEMPKGKSEITISSGTQAQEIPDFGIIPELQKKSRRPCMRLHAETQIDTSFYDFLNSQKEVVRSSSTDLEFFSDTDDVSSKETLDQSEGTAHSVPSDGASVSLTKSEKSEKSENETLHTQVFPETESYSDENLLLEAEMEAEALEAESSTNTL